MLSLAHLQQPKAMEHSAFLLLLFSGLCTLCSCLSHQYHFVNVEKSWTEAQSYCRENYTDLATIDSTEEMKSLMEAVGSAYVKESAWIGLYDDISSWRWSLADPGFYREGETEFRNWYPGEPNNVGGREHCVAIYDSGKWNDFPCDGSTDTGFFVCYHAGGENSNQRYILIEQSKTWTEAQRYCREHHTDLVSVRNQTENEEVNRLIPAGKWVWIGLYRDSWKWSDQGNSSFRNWSSGEPNNAGGQENCAKVQLNGTERGGWIDASCSERLPFFCYSKTADQQCSQKTPGSKLHWNHPAVTEFILQQVRRKLIEKGMPEDIKVMWKTQPNGDVFRVEKRKKP
ncbi:hypothetical protein MATL_G00199710 [Megalops atlanticus]|uniref:C-type lectin domain-containing protein n=1 Tax=Megalops atlanticus TaxID=7932 RepID=A0A9D3PJZ1_MEGAT|nr:hypothetical protein MATL_G00199710 [Megalops atlanticus]